MKRLRQVFRTPSPMLLMTFFSFRGSCLYERVIYLSHTGTGTYRYVFLEEDLLWVLNVHPPAPKIKIQLISQIYKIKIGFVTSKALMFRYIIFLIRYTVSILQLPRCWGTGAGEQKLFGGAGAVIYKFVRLLLQCSRAEIILLFNKYFTVHCTVRVRYPKSLPVPVFSVEDARKLISKPMIHEDIPVPVLIIIFLLQYPGSYYRYRTGMFCRRKNSHFSSGSTGIGLELKSELERK